MKVISAFFTLALLCCLSLRAQISIAAGPNEIAPTTVSFSETVYDFGVVEQGTPITHQFTMTNTGTHDLVIQGVKRSCPCTPVEWSEGAIKPGQSGWVKISITPSPGTCQKNFTLLVNTEPPVVLLTFQGEVKKKEEMNLNGGTMMDAQPVAPSQNAVEHNPPH